MNPPVTVLMTVYNALPYLSEAIESILGQTFKEFEFLIIDDASTDGSEERIRSYHDNRIRFLPNEKNLGTAGSMNRGIAEARAPIIMRMDHDDVSMPSRLEHQLAYLDRYSEVAAVCSWEHTIDEKGRIMRSWRAEIKNRGEFFGPLLLGLCPIWHPSLMVRIEALRSIGGFRESSWPAEDFDVTMRLALAGYGAAIVPEFLLLQRQHQRRQSIQSEEKQRSATARLHTAVIAQCCPNLERAAELAAFLRCEKPLRGIARSKEEALAFLEMFEHTVKRFATTLQFSASEQDRMRKILRRRLGFGPSFGLRHRRLPAWLWFFCFDVTSPLLHPRLRERLALWYRVFWKLRHPRQFFVR